MLFRCARHKMAAAPSSTEAAVPVPLKPALPARSLTDFATDMLAGGIAGAYAYVITTDVQLAAINCCAPVAKPVVTAPRLLSQD